MKINLDDIKFLSDNHIRYENGQIAITPASDNQGNNKGVNRGIQIESNIGGGEGYTVTIFNMDGNHPLWGNNVQMAPKQMKIISSDEQKIVLRGFGEDLVGESFSNYGLSLYHNGEVPYKLKLHLHDRNIDIEYFKSEKIVAPEPEIIALAKKAIAEYRNGTPDGSRPFLVQIYRSVKSDPNQLNNVSDFESLGKAFVLMMDQNLTDDIDTLQMMVSVGYLCISKAIEKDVDNADLFKDRLLLMRIGHNPLRYTVMSALRLNAGGFMSSSFSNSDLKARDEISRMEICDLELNPILYQYVDLLRERKIELDQMIQRDFFLPQKTLEDIIKAGIDNHVKMQEYLEKRVLIDNDVDF